MSEEQVKRLAAVAFELIYYAGLISHEDDITKMNFNDAMSLLEKKKDEMESKKYMSLFKV